jgi:hypothetical protein
VTTTPCPARQTDAVGAALDCELPAGHEGAHEAHTTPDVTVTWTGGSTTATDPQHARARRRHTIRWLLSLTSLTPAGHAELRTAVDAEIADADEAHTRLADYENRISWETTCGEHARLLDACRAADERVEKADAVLVRVRRQLAASDASADALLTRAEKAEAAIERVRDECAAIEQEQYGQHDEDADGMREAVRRLRAALDGTGDAEPAPAPQPKPPGIFSGVQGRCPACRRAALILSTGGYIICGHLECPDPEAAAKLLERDEPAVDWQDIAAQREHTLGQVRAVRDHWIRNTLEPGQVRRLLDDLTHALDGAEPATPDPDPCDTYQPPTTPEDSGYCAHCGMSDYKHRAGPADRRILAAFRPLFTPETPHTPV